MSQYLQPKDPTVLRPPQSVEEVRMSYGASQCLQLIDANVPMSPEVRREVEIMATQSHGANPK
jgi:hypothetical protein